MLNQLVIVGRLVRNPELKKTEKNKDVLNITVAIPRSFKNQNGEYETDFIDVVMWDSVASSTAEFCKKGDIVGIRGRIQSYVKELDDGSKKYGTEVIAEKITFLTSKKEEAE